MIKKKKVTKRIGIIGFPMDLGADRRGVDMGPSAIRYAGLEQKLENLGYTVTDFGDITVEISETQKIRNPKLKYLPEIARTSKVLAGKVESMLNKNLFPLVIGGDHATAIGTIAGISKFCKRNGLKFGTIWVDAHSDMNTPDTTPSGNIHGMPLAISLGLGDRKLTHLNGYAPKLEIDNVALIGIRDVDPEEAKTIKRLKPAIYTMTDVDKLGIHKIIDDVLKDFRDTVDFVHVSFDMDGVDPDYAHGVGTPVPGGLTYREAQLLMEMVADFGSLSALEMLEVNPILDIKNETAILATDLIASALGKSTLYDQNTIMTS